MINIEVKNNILTILPTFIEEPTDIHLDELSDISYKIKTEFFVSLNDYRSVGYLFGTQKGTKEQIKLYTILIARVYWSSDSDKWLPYIGNVAYNKNVDEFIDLYNRIKEKHIEWWNNNTTFDSLTTIEELFDFYKNKDSEIEDEEILSKIGSIIMKNVFSTTNKDIFLSEPKTLLNTLIIGKLQYSGYKFLLKVASNPFEWSQYILNGILEKPIDDIVNCSTDYRYEDIHMYDMNTILNYFIDIINEYPLFRNKYKEQLIVSYVDWHGDYIETEKYKCYSITTLVNEYIKMILEKIITEYKENEKGN